MGYLYNAGDQCTSITGGWKTNTSYAINTVTNGEVEINTFYKNVGTISYNSSNIVLNHPKSVGYGGIMMQTTKAINFVSQGIDSITINCSTSVSGWGYNQDAWDANKPYAWWDIGIIPSFSDGQNLSVYYHHGYDDGYINSAASPIQTRTESFSRTIEGLSKITGSFYVVVGIYRSVDADFSLTVNSITTASAATSNSPKTIWDFNGTTYSKIKTIYDNNGSTSSKIKYVYDNNGSTNSLVYSSEQSVYPGTTPIKLYTSGSPSISGFKLSSPGYAEAYGIYYVTLDLTGWNTLSISGKYNNYTGIYLATSLPQANANPGCLAMANGGTFGSYTYTNVWHKNNNSGSYTSTATTFSEDVNVSSYSGTYYLVISLYASNVTWGGQFVEITSAVLK